MYRVIIEKKAAKAIKELPEEIIGRMISTIDALKENPVQKGSLKLKGRFKNGYRLRVGNYRVLYTINEGQKEVSVFQVGHRREIYR
ncbi:MAG TPA: type II toxin-antitoxin system RelE family toxin [Candidatus Avalokitesvara rifleensis]|uniref:type II toxin-antitoxin system RelE family toxin n=1 Tax=Candidatus Avalokitesvara rifleensis TaxID=3367620 RepID=UPI002713D0F4|nr:type II toxin-antitoxin system RelE/ParE family toxin [Candidatus Brocadiales bacterium]